MAAPIWWSVGRSVLGVVAGAVVHGLVVTGVHMIGHSIYGALPPDTFERTWEQKTALIHSLPVGSLVFVVASWAAGVFTGGLVAARIAGFAPYTHAGIIGGLDLLGVGLMMTMLPHPLWMATLGPACVVLAALAAGRVAQSLNPGSGDTRGAPTRTPAAGPEAGATAGAA